MYLIDEDCIYRVAPKFSGEKAKAQKRIVSAISPVFAWTLDAYEIDSFLRVAHFLSQITHECAGFRTTEEFASGEAYEGRNDLGNIHAGDGKRFKGRGLLQLTGRANYRRLGIKLGLPLEDEPSLAGDPVVSLKIACEYWNDRNISRCADLDDLVAVTRKINGGLNGLSDRSENLKKAKVVLAGLLANVVAKYRPILHRGLFGADVEALQVALRGKGYLLAIDQDFGAATELAVKMFQSSQNLTPDGIVGTETWAALSSQQSKDERTSQANVRTASMGHAVSI